MLLYTDGASRGNPGEAAICFRLLAPNRDVLSEQAVRVGRLTNNQAEYRALLAGLNAALAYAPAILHCFSDSEVMVKQMRREYRVKKPALRALWEQAQSLAGRFARIEFSHVPRTDPDIARADALANQALDAAG